MIIDLVDSHPIFLNMLGKLLQQASTDFNVRIFGSLSKTDILIPKKCADLMILGVNVAPGSNEQFEYTNFYKQCPATKVIIYYENADSAAVYVDKGVDALICKTKDLSLSCLSASHCVTNHPATRYLKRLRLNTNKFYKFVTLILHNHLPQDLPRFVKVALKNCGRLWQFNNFGYSQR